MARVEAQQLATVGLDFDAKSPWVARVIYVLNRRNLMGSVDVRVIDTLAEKSPILIAGDDDQALYSFRDASPDFIRRLAEQDDIERFDLPYCSRCTVCMAHRGRMVSPN